MKDAKRLLNLNLRKIEELKKNKQGNIGDLMEALFAYHLAYYLMTGKTDANAHRTLHTSWESYEIRKKAKRQNLVYSGRSMIESVGKDIVATKVSVDYPKKYAIYFKNTNYDIIFDVDTFRKIRSAISGIKNLSPVVEIMKKKNEYLDNFTEEKIVFKVETIGTTSNESKADIKFNVKIENGSKVLYKKEVNISLKTSSDTVKTMGSIDPALAFVCSITNYDVSKVDIEKIKTPDDYKNELVRIFSGWDDSKKSREILLDFIADFVFGMDPDLYFMKFSKVVPLISNQEIARNQLKRNLINAKSIKFKANDSQRFGLYGKSARKDSGETDVQLITLRVDPTKRITVDIMSELFSTELISE